MIRKAIIILSVLFLLFLGYLVSKFLWFNFNEDIYFTEGRTYDGETEFIVYQAEKREVKKHHNIEHFIETEYSDMTFKLPYYSETDSLYSKIVDGALLSGALKDGISKRVIVHYEGRDDITKQVKKELKNIDKDIDTTSSFDTYKTLYNHIPDISLFTDSYSSIKRDIGLSALKALNSVSGADKRLFGFEINAFKGFQYCIPSKCRNTFIRLFDENNNETALIFKNFTQEEIDFVLSSMKYD